jgi:hypothetical protein
LFQTNVGPILLAVNPYSDVGNPLTLSSTRGIPLSSKLVRVVQDAVRQQSETGYPQAIILSGNYKLNDKILNFQFLLFVYKKKSRLKK